MQQKEVKRMPIGDLATIALNQDLKSDEGDL